MSEVMCPACGELIEVRPQLEESIQAKIRNELFTEGAQKIEELQAEIKRLNELKETLLDDYAKLQKKVFAQAKRYNALDVRHGEAIEWSDHWCRRAMQFQAWINRPWLLKVIDFFMRRKLEFD